MCHFEPLEGVAELGQVLERGETEPGDDDHAVHGLCERMAVGDPEQRGPVDDHVLVVALLDRREERRERLAEEQLRRIRDPGAARDHVEVVADPANDELGALVDRHRERIRARAVGGGGDQDVGEPGRERRLEQLVQGREAEVAGDQQRLLAHARKRACETRGGARLALALDRAGDQDHLLLRRRQVKADRGLEGLVRLVGNRAHELAPAAEARTDEWQADEQREPEHAAHLARAADPRRQPVTGERGDDPEEEGGEERQHAVPDRPGRVRSVRHLGRDRGEVRPGGG